MDDGYVFQGPVRLEGRDPDEVLVDLVGVCELVNDLEPHCEGYDRFLVYRSDN